jgi:hypothetical protein
MMLVVEVDTGKLPGKVKLTGCAIAVIGSIISIAILLIVRMCVLSCVVESLRSLVGWRSETQHKIYQLKLRQREANLLSALKRHARTFFCF